MPALAEQRLLSATPSEACADLQITEQPEKVCQQVDANLEVKSTRQGCLQKKFSLLNER